MPKASSKKKKASPLRKVSKTLKIKKQKPIGIVTHFYGNISVAIVKFKTTVKVGTAIKFSGSTTDFGETIRSMQFNHKPVSSAKKGQQVGIEVKNRVREGDNVYLAE
ncbi:MAG: hypothetical protein AAB602_02880 [Patescibacteria group bacterium]